MSTDTNSGAYYNDPQIKAEVLARVLAAEQGDRIIQGDYYDDETECGCAVGIVVHSGNHATYSKELNIPVGLAILKDIIHERLPNGQYQLWPRRFLSAIEVGADLSLVFWQLMYWNIADDTHGLITLVEDEELRQVFRAGGALFARKAQGQAVEDAEWSAIEKEIRAFALDLARGLEFARARARAFARAFAFARALGLEFDLDLEFALDRALDLDLARALGLEFDLDRARALDRADFHLHMANKLCFLLATAPEAH